MLPFIYLFFNITHRLASWACLSGTASLKSDGRGAGGHGQNTGSTTEPAPQRATRPGEAGGADGENTAIGEQARCPDRLTKWKAGLQSDFQVYLFQALQSQHPSAVWWRVDCMSPGSKIPGWRPGCLDNPTHPSAQSACWAEPPPTTHAAEEAGGSSWMSPRASPDAPTPASGQSATPHLGTFQAVRTIPGLKQCLLADSRPWLNVSVEMFFRWD